MYSKTFTRAYKCGIFGWLICSCQIAPLQNKESTNPIASTNPPPNTIVDIPLPEGFTRITYTANSFAHWLRKITLKQDPTVYLYDGRVKANQEAQYAVMDITVGNRDLQQCADAAIRLRAEYLFEKELYHQIVFTDNESGEYRFTAPYTRTRFDAFLPRVFGMCGSASLAKQLHAKILMQMQPGDVLIRGGFPGHAATVMDMAINQNGEKIYLLSQGYMPAQDIHILKNPTNNISPWYQLTEHGNIQTPEYTFYDHELKGW